MKVICEKCGTELTKDILDEDGCCPECGEFIFFEDDDSEIEKDTPLKIGCPKCYAELQGLYEDDIPDEGIICPNCNQIIYRSDVLFEDSIAITRTLTDKEIAEQKSEATFNRNLYKN